MNVLVALNYQTRCDEMEINNGKFRQNGNCGYVLKPRFQRLFEDFLQSDSPKKSSSTFLKLFIVGGKTIMYFFNYTAIHRAGTRTK